MKKSIKKVTVLALTLLMLIGTCLTAFATDASGNAGGWTVNAASRAYISSATASTTCSGYDVMLTTTSTIQYTDSDGNPKSKSSSASGYYRADIKFNLSSSEKTIRVDSAHVGKNETNGVTWRGTTYAVY